MIGSKIGPEMSIAKINSAKCESFCNVENKLPWKFLPANISSRENFFPWGIFSKCCVEHPCNLVIVVHPGLISYYFAYYLVYVIEVLQQFCFQVYTLILFYKYKIYFIYVRHLFFYVLVPKLVFLSMVSSSEVDTPTGILWE